MKKLDMSFKKTTLGVCVLAATLSSMTFADNTVQGNGAKVDGSDKAVALGDSVLIESDSNQAVAIGSNAVIQKNSSLAIAIGAHSNADQAGAVALGAGSDTKTNATAASDITVKDGNGNDITISASNFAGNENISAGDQVSVGSIKNERQIKNVAAGIINKTSTDAVNGSQLYEVVDNLAKGIKTTQTEVTEGKNVTVTSTTGANGQTVYNVATKDDVDFEKVTVGKVVVDKVKGIDAGDTKITNVTAGGVSATSKDAINGSQLYEEASKAKTEVTEGKNVTVTSTTGANGQTVYNVATKDDVDFEKVTVGKVVVDKVKGIDAGDTKITNVTAGGVSATSKDAINGSQLYEEASKAKTEVIEGKNVTVTSTMGANGQTVYNVATKDDVDFEKVTVGKVVVDKVKGIDAGDTKITNVTAGGVSATSKDAINGSQLYEEASKAKTEVIEGKNVTVTSTMGANGQTVYNVATKDDVDFEKVTVGKVVVDKVKGIDAGDTKITNVTAGGVSATSKDAINGSQLYEEASKAKTEVIEGKNVTVTSTMGANGQTVYNVATKDDVDFEKVTVGKVVVDKVKGIDAGDTKITNVTAGGVSATSKDAINGSQLYEEASKAKTEVTEGKNVTVTSTTGANGQTVYNVATKDDVDFEKVTVGKVVVDKVKGIDAGDTKITNVTAGGVSATSKDAINGSQLYEEASKAKTEVTEGKNVTVTSTTGANGQTVYNVATKDDVDFEKVTVGKVVVDKVKGIDAGDTKITNVTAGGVSATSKDAINGSQLYEEASKAKTEVTEGKNVTVTSTTGANGQTVYNVATKDDVDFEKVTVGKVVVDKVKGIDAGDTKITNVTAGDVSATSKDAINGSQLYEEASKAKTEVTEGKNVTVTSTTGANGQTVYNVATKDDVDFEKVTVGKVVVDKVKGIDAGNTQITHVTAGTKVTDAVNLGQLQSTVSIFGGGSTIHSDGSIKNPTYNVNGGTYNNVGDALGALNQVDIDLGNRITNLQQTFNKRIDDVEDKLSAGVASALALESAPYVAGKYTYAAGSGFYNGQSALGVSLRKTADNGRWSLTGGVAAASQGEASFRIGINGVID